MLSIESAGEIELGPGHTDHGRVEWPDDMRSHSIKLSTSLHRLLTHNNVPSIREYEEIRNVREEIQAKMDAKQKDIRFLEEELMRKKDEQKQLETQYFALGIPLAPIRRIPSDILYRIIETCPRHDDVRNGDLTFCRHIPTTLSHVCQSWRQTVHGISSAWQDIRIVSSTTRSHRDALPDQKCQFEHYSKLSGVLPLRLYLDGSHGMEADNQADDLGMTPFIDWMVRHCGENNKSLDRLELLCPGQNKLDLLEHFANAASGAYALQVKTCVFFSSSDSWNIHTAVSAATMDTDAITQLLNHLPQVRHLWLGNSFNKLPLSLLPPQTLTGLRQTWSQLTRLRLEVTLSTGNLGLINILSFCTHLEEAHFNIRCNNEHPPPQFGNTLVHPHLKELCVDLSISQVDHNPLVPAFIGCQFPNVTSLQLQLWKDGLGYYGPADTPAVYANAFPSLKSLIINNASRRFDDGSFWMKIISPFRMCSTITDFTIFCHDLAIAHQFDLFSIAREWENGLPLPSLQNLQLRTTGVGSRRAEPAPEDSFRRAQREIESLVAIRHHRPPINISIHWLIPDGAMCLIRYPHPVHQEDITRRFSAEIFINHEKSFFDGDGSNFGIDAQIVQGYFDRVFDLFQEHPMT